MINQAEHLTAQQLEDYAAETLDKRERRAVGIHLLKCVECRGKLPLPTPEQFWRALMTEREPDEFEHLSASQTGASDSFVSPATGFLKTLFRPQNLAFAGGAMLLIVSFFFYISLTPKKQFVETTIAQQESNASKQIHSENSESLEVPEGATSSNDSVGNVKPENTTNNKPVNTSSQTKTERAAIVAPPQNNLAEKEIAVLLQKTPAAVLSLRSGGQIILRSNETNSSPSKTFPLIAPVGVTTLEPTPEFRWTAVAGATSYRLSVMNSKYDEILNVTTTKPSFKADKPFSRGEVYLWRVTAQLDADKTVIAPQPPQPPALFRVAAEKTVRQIARSQSQKSDKLALAALYAKEGMLDSAASILREILRENPRNRAARRLLRRVESWRAENETSVQCESPTATKADQ